MTPKDPAHDYGILFANEEGEWLFAHVNKEGEQTTESFPAPLHGLRMLSERGWDVVNAYAVDKKSGLNGDRFLLWKEMPASKKGSRIGIR